MAKNVECHHFCSVWMILAGLVRQTDAHTDIVIVFIFANVVFLGAFYMTYCCEMIHTKNAVRERVKEVSNLASNSSRYSMACLSQEWKPCVMASSWGIQWPLSENHAQKLASLPLWSYVSPPPPHRLRKMVLPYVLSCPFVHRHCRKVLKTYSAHYYPAVLRTSDLALQGYHEPSNCQLKNRKKLSERLLLISGIIKLLATCFCIFRLQLLSLR